MIPLFQRFPALARLPRAALGEFPSPVERVTTAAGELWIKRDDLNAPLLGGNKLRALEFLLGDVRPGETILTLGGEGSTHVLATAVHAARLGARTVAVRWPHEMHAVAHDVGRAARARCAEVVPARNAGAGVLRVWLLRARRQVRYIPLGGGVPLGVLGQVNAALELAEQVSRGELPPPARLVVPLGTGATAAGLALGLATAGLDTVVIGARVGPRFANRRRAVRLARATATFMRRLGARDVPHVPASRLTVTHAVFGGAYGRPLAAAGPAEAMLRRAGGPPLDATYSAKGFAAALVAAAAPGPTLFWLTFDARWMDDDRAVW